MSSRPLSRIQVIGALTALGVKLDSRGIRAEMFVVGGAAMALVYSSRRLTRDIDAVFVPKTAVYAAAAEVARDRGLPSGWLNDAVKGFLPPVPDKIQPAALDVPGLEVIVASPEYLLAMKLLAMRIGEDTDDIRVLLGILNITDAGTALNMLERFYPYRELPPKTRFFLEELLE